MAPTWLIRGRGIGGTAHRYNSRSLFRHALFYQFSILNSNPETSQLRSFNTTSMTDNVFDANHNPISSRSSKDNNPSTNSNRPPNPIPNRPFRAESNTFDRRQPIIHSSQFTRSSRPGNNPNRDASGADFLEKFKFGFESKDGDDDVDGNRCNMSRASSEAEPAPPQDADEIFKKMKETGLVPNAVAMLDGLCKDGLVQEAMKLFGVMREKGTIPEVVIYTAVVEGFCKAHKFDDAVRIFRKMQSNNVIPNAFSYGILIQGLCKGKRLDDALEFSLEALEAGISLNLASFTSLVDGFCREKGFEDAKSLIAKLRQKGFFFDEKSVREYLDRKGPFLPVVWETILGRKASQRSSLFE